MALIIEKDDDLLTYKTILMNSNFHGSEYSYIQEDTSFHGVFYIGKKMRVVQIDETSTFSVNIMTMNYKIEQNVREIVADLKYLRSSLTREKASRLFVTFSESYNEDKKGFVSKKRYENLIVELFSKMSMKLIFFGRLDRDFDGNVININNSKTFDIYAGRSESKSGYFGNPIRIGQECPICGEKHRGGGSTLPCFKEFFEYRIETDEEYRMSILSLNSLDLGCFCKPKKCHCDIIIKYLRKNSTPA